MPAAIWATRSATIPPPWRKTAAVSARPSVRGLCFCARVVRLTAAQAALPPPVADASLTTEPGLACSVLVADCLPVLLAAPESRGVAAAHAGWRGLAAGVLEATVRALPAPASELIAWLGPAIGPAAFQVGSEVRAAFVGQAVEDAAAFVADGERWRADLFALARARLVRCGVAAVYGGGICTVADSARFFSHRRDGLSGRFASLIVIDR